MEMVAANVDVEAVGVDVLNFNETIDGLVGGKNGETKSSSSALLIILHTEVLAEEKMSRNRRGENVLWSVSGHGRLWNSSHVHIFIVVLRSVDVRVILVHSAAYVGYEVL